jgi:predicted DNA-binding transcriptional regulator AlpA
VSLTKQGIIPTHANERATAAADGFLTSAQVRQRYGGASDMWLHRRLRDGSGFPKPMLVEGRRFWRISELEAWERARAKASA